MSLGEKHRSPLFSPACSPLVTLIVIISDTMIDSAQCSISTIISSKSEIFCYLKLLETALMVTWTRKFTVSVLIGRYACHSYCPPSFGEEMEDQTDEKKCLNSFPSLSHTHGATDPIIGQKCTFRNLLP